MTYKTVIILTVMALVLIVGSASAITADIGDNPAQEKALINNGNENVAHKISVEERHIREVNRPPGPRRDERGGPDDMGYEWRDNLEDDGPEFEWIDLNQFNNVQEFQLGDDYNTGVLQLGWTFPFWDRAFSQIYCNTDGWASFTYAGNSFYLPVHQYPIEANPGTRNHATIAIFQADFQQGTEIWFWTNEQDQAIISWAGDHQFHFQLILHDNGYAVMQYGENINQSGRIVKIGVNLGDGDHGWFITGFLTGPDQDYIIPGRAIAFGPHEVWLGPEELILELKDYLLYLWNDNKRIRIWGKVESWGNFLDHALDALGSNPPNIDGPNGAIYWLNHFITKVGVARDKINPEISAIDAAELITMAQHIIDLLSGNGDASDPGIALTEQTPLPSGYYLSEAYPNPFNAVTRLSYGLPDAARVSIRVYSISGELVSSLVDGEQAVGNYTAIWDGNGSPTGVYLVRMESSGFSAVRKIMLVK